MPKILSAKRTSVLIDGELVEGLQEISFQAVTPYTDIDAIGSAERVGVVFGSTHIAGTLRVRSVVDALESALRDKRGFQILASVTDDAEEPLHDLTLQECQIHGKSYAMGAGGVAETIYQFSATRESSSPTGGGE